MGIEGRCLRKQRYTTWAEAEAVCVRINQGELRGIEELLLAYRNDSGCKSLNHCEACDRIIGPILYHRGMTMFPKFSPAPGDCTNEKAWDDGFSTREIPCLEYSQWLNVQYTPDEDYRTRPLCGSCEQKVKAAAGLPVVD